MVNAWNVEQLGQMTLPPCHYGFQLYVRNGKYLSLMWNQRSVDTFLGLPFNIASYALLLMIIAKEVDMIPDELIGNLGDVHIYKNHVEQATVQMQREPKKLPFVSIKTKDDLINTMEVEDVTLINYESHPAIKAPLSNKRFDYEKSTFDFSYDVLFNHIGTIYRRGRNDCLCT